MRLPNLLMIQMKSFNSRMKTSKMIMKQRLNKEKKATLDCLNLKQIKKAKSKNLFQIQDNKMKLTQMINPNSPKIRIKKNKILTRNQISNLNPIKLSHLSLNKMNQEKMMMNYLVVQLTHLYFQTNQAYRTQMNNNLMKLMLGKILIPKP